MAENSSDELHQQKSSARERLDEAAARPRVSASDVLPRKIRLELVAAMTSNDFIVKAQFGRGASQRARWAALVNAGAKQPRTLGFVDVSGGTDSLALLLGCGDQSTWSRTLNKWATAEHPLVVCGSVAQGRGRPSLRIVQIPLLTEWLVWVAEANAIRLKPTSRDHLWRSHIGELAVLGARQLVPPPSPDLTRNQADLILDDLKRRHARTNG